MLNEFQTTQNPGWGAALIWRFSLGFQREAGHPPTLVLAFLVLPIVLHEDTCKRLTSTHAGLSKFEEKFSREYDVLASVGQRAVALRDLTLRSIAIGVASGLYTIDVETGTIVPREGKPEGVLQPDEEKILRGAERLGAWIGSTPIATVRRIFRMDF